MGAYISLASRLSQHQREILFFDFNELNFLLYNLDGNSFIFILLKGKNFIKSSFRSILMYQICLVIKNNSLSY